VDSHPEKPSLAQIILGAVFLVALGTVPIIWSVGEADTGNRIFLWALGGLLLGLATWRAGIAVRLAREQRASSR
jgi:hypothetical protein